MYLQIVRRWDGLGIYIDTERAGNKEFMKRMGINWDKLYLPKPVPSTIEEVFEFIEEVVKYTRIKVSDKSRPVVVVWDSVAATQAKDEQETAYGESPGLGLEARVMSRGFKKAIKMLDEGYVTLICINQLREKIGSFGWGDNDTTPHGKALAFYASVRVKLKSKMQIKNSKTEETVGVNTTAKVFKNKVGPNHREVDFPLYYDWGVNDEISLMDFLVDQGIISSEDPNKEKPKDTKEAKEEKKPVTEKKKKSSWKYLSVGGHNYKWQGTSEWTSMLKDPEIKKFVVDKIGELMIKSFEARPEEIGIDTEDLMEMEQLKIDLKVT